MPREFQGTINLDIRDSEQDWDAYLPNPAPDGAPNVHYLEEVLEAARVDGYHVTLPITDPYVRHHGARDGESHAALL